MTIFTYNIEEHLTPTDQKKIAQAAQSRGQNIGDYIEETLKRALYAHPPSPLPIPAQKPPTQAPNKPSR